MSVGDLPYPQWQKPVLQAVMEMKPDNILEGIEIAETAIDQRLRELAIEPECTSKSQKEQVALLDAASKLGVLKSVLIDTNGSTD